MKNKTDKDLVLPELYRGLEAISRLSFPKKCKVCGEEYENEADFISRTMVLRKSTGLKSDIDDDGQVVVELFRNCVCGSTLMDEFSDRRDLTANGILRRKKFEELLQRLVSAGFTEETARRELVSIIQGRGSRLLKVKSSGVKQIDSPEDQQEII